MLLVYLYDFTSLTLLLARIISVFSLCYCLIGYSLASRLFPETKHKIEDRLLLSVPLSVLTVTFSSFVFLKVQLFNAPFLWAFFLVLFLLLIKRDTFFIDCRRVRDKLYFYGKHKLFAVVFLLILLSIISTHFIIVTLLYFPQLPISWLYYGPAAKIAMAEQFVESYMQYGQLLPMSYTYLGFTVFNSVLIKMAAVSNVQFIYFFSLVNLILFLIF